MLVPVLVQLNLDSLSRLLDNLVHLAEVFENTATGVFKSGQGHLWQSTNFLGDEAGLELGDAAQVNVDDVVKAHQLDETLVLHLVRLHHIGDELRHSAYAFVLVLIG